MSLLRKKTPDEVNLKDLTDQLDRCRERQRVLQQATRALLILLKEATFELQEINADGQKKRIDQLLQTLPTGEAATLQRQFETQTTAMYEFLHQERDYLATREKELKGIIDFLRRSITDLLGENLEFNAEIYERNSRIERTSQFDDLRKVREALKIEVDQVREVIKKKQDRDEQSKHRLQREVSSLKTDLERAVDASMTDALTGAQNRLAFDMHLARLIERNVVSQAPFALLMCDLDNFKLVNDTYGHPVGDRVLKCFVQECRTLFRNDDYVARYGGEEFVIILPNSSLSQALKRARTLCKTLSAKRFLVDPNRPETGISFTVSIGVSETHRGITGEEMIARADKALYHAKHTGKNRAVSEHEVK